MKKSKLAIVAAAILAPVAAFAAPPDLTAISTEGVTGIASGVSAGIPIAGAMLAITVAIMVFRKVRRAGT